MAVGLPVGLGAAGKVVALYYPGKALALGDAGNINQIAFFEQADINLIAYFNVSGIG